MTYRRMVKHHNTREKNRSCITTEAAPHTTDLEAFNSLNPHVAHWSDAPLWKVGRNIG
jgi:hypothetical protein